MRFKGALLVTALASSLALVTLPATAARADSTAPLTLPQLTHFHQILVDDAAGYVFLSEGTESAAWAEGYGSAAAGIVVTGLSGNYVTTLDVGDGVEGLALSPDGKTLYAALAAVDAVGVIDAAALTQTTTYPLATAGTAPYSLALQAGKLWVSYDVAATDLQPLNGGIGDFDLSAENPSFQVQPAMGGAQPGFFAWSSAPDIAADPADTGVLVAVIFDGPPLVVTYKVSADPATVLSQGTEDSGCAEHSLAVFPGGAQFAVCGTILNTADLSGSVADTNSGGTLALSPTGELLAIGGGTLAGSNVQVDQVNNDGGNWPNTFSFASPEILAAGGLAFGANGSRLYAVLENIAGTAYELQIIDNPGATSSRLTLSAPSTAAVGNGYTITGSLTLSTGSPVAGTPVTITRAQAGSPDVQFALTTGANGQFSLTDKPASAGTYTYSAEYAAYGVTAAASRASATVDVGQITNTTPPAVSGTVKVGSIVTAAPGGWTPPGATLGYQWLANGSPLNSATGSSYTIPATLAGQHLSVMVTASKAGYVTASATSPATVVALGTITSTAAPTISGTVRAGSAVTATPGGWAPSGGLTFAYQWLANGAAVSGATHSTYVIAPGLAGRRLSVHVTVSRAGYTTTTVSSIAKAIAKGVFIIKVKPRLTGRAAVGKTLSVTKGTWSPAATIKVQWYANGKAISRATGLTLKLASNMRGRIITVVVTASRTGYTTATVHLKEAMRIV